ncbi:UNVERIFIED_CONTAM: hypothetical protein FKN15_047952 [Acipenser sinensis]
MKCLREKGQGPRIDQYFLRTGYRWIYNSGNGSLAVDGERGIRPFAPADSQQTQSFVRTGAAEKSSTTLQYPVELPVNISRSCPLLLPSPVSSFPAPPGAFLVLT